MTRIAFVSCCRGHSFDEQPVWADIEAENPDLLLLLGDTVYMNNREWRHWELDRYYQMQFDDPYFASLIEKVPYLATWDDHDFGPNDSRGAEKDGPKNRRKSRNRFYKYMIDDRIWPYVSHPKRSGIFYSYDLSDIRIIMLDVRYYRTYSRRRKATMLGFQQERWFWDQLDNDKRYTIVGAGTCVDSGAPGTTWKDFERFYEEFDDWVIADDRVLVVSGDIHYNKFRKHGQFHEAISSGVGRAEKLGSGKWGKNLANYGILDLYKSKIKVTMKGRKSRANFRYEVRSSDWSARKL